MYKVSKSNNHVKDQKALLKANIPLYSSNANGKLVQKKRNNNKRHLKITKLGSEEALEINQWYTTSHWMYSLTLPPFASYNTYCRRSGRSSCAYQSKWFHSRKASNIQIGNLQGKSRLDRKMEAFGSEFVLDIPFQVLYFYLVLDNFVRDAVGWNIENRNIILELSQLAENGFSMDSLDRCLRSISIG